MAEPTETITQQLIHRATDPFSLAILVGVASSSFFFFGNLGLALDGILPATITESERARERISDASALKMWEWMYHRGKKHFGSTGLLGGISYLVASAFRPDLRPILYGASLFSFAPLLYTGVVLRPINNDIFNATAAASTHGGKEPDPELVDKLFSEWRKHNSIRMSIAAVAWALGMVVLILA